MKTILRALLWLMAITVLVLVVQGQESEIEMDLTNELDGRDLEGLTKVHGDHRLHEEEKKVVLDDGNADSDDSTTIDADEDFRRSQNEPEPEDSSDEEDSDVLDEVEKEEDRLLRRQRKPAVTSWNYAPEPLKYHEPIPSKKTSNKKWKKHKVKKSKTKDHKKGFNHKKAASPHAKYTPVPAPAKKVPEWTPVFSEKAPVIFIPPKKKTTYKMLKKEMNRKSKKYHGFGGGKKY